jgi:hypothetical protein
MPMSVVQYYPFNGSKNRLRLGLASIPAADWIQYDDDFAKRISEKKSLISEHPNRVIQSVDGSEAVQNELLQNILSFIAENKSDLFTVNDNAVRCHADDHEYTFNEYASAPLELISYLVPDDFCLLEQYDDDYRLVAASVCNPTYWELSEKMGSPLQDVHAPIPNLENTIGRMIRHFLAKLTIDDYFLRSNWFLTTDPNLPLFKDRYDLHNKTEDLNIDTIDKKLFLRCERQSFRKLKNTKNIAFGINIYVSPMSIVKQHNTIAEDLLLAINTMTIDQKKLLGINAYEKPLVEYLHGVL